MEIFCHRTARFAVSVHHVEHKTKNQHTNCGTDPHHNHMDIVGNLAYFSDSLRHIELSGRVFCIADASSH